jgi:Zn finger protein HypA/HybF involved in hydrogenase expression
MTAQNLVCEKCESTKVRFQADVKFNGRTQKFQIDQVFARGYCQNCGNVGSEGDGFVFCDTTSPQIEYVC